MKKSRQAKSERRLYVAFQPASETRQAELLRGQQASREQRAADQAGKYLFVLNASRTFFHCWNLNSGEVYETSVYPPDFMTARFPKLWPCGSLVEG